MMADSEFNIADDPVLAASTVGLGIIVRSLAPALEQVTLQQYRVLVLLVTRGPLRAGDLAIELGLLPSGITRMVDRLVRDGLVDKRTSDVSAREVVVTALDSATALVESVFARRRADFQEVMQHMTPQERSLVSRAAAAFAHAAAPDLLTDASLLLTGAKEQPSREDERHE